MLTRSKGRPRFFHSYGVIELDAAITLLLAKVRSSPPVRQLSERSFKRVFSICIRHELSEPVSSGSLYDYQCDLSRTARATDLARAGPESPGLCYAKTSVCDIEPGGSGFTAGAAARLGHRGMAAALNMAARDK